MDQLHSIRGEYGCSIAAFTDSLFDVGQAFLFGQTVQVNGDGGVCAVGFLGKIEEKNSAIGPGDRLRAEAVSRK